MSDKNQSSVEWLLKKIIESNASKHGDVLLKKFLSHQDLEQAKAMHREEIIKSWMAVNNELQRIAAEKYYNETFGK